MNKCRSEQDTTANGTWNATWMLRLPTHHPMWSEYVIFLYDLAPHENVNPAVLRRPWMTHEFIAYALAPDTPLDFNKTFVEQAKAIAKLTPANHGYQFEAKSNELAFNRINGVVADLIADKLSIDTDYRSTWDRRFSDGATLILSAYDMLAAQHAVKH
jgi:hypothetical protein